MSNSCIVVIDPQKDFISESGNYAGRHNGIRQMLDAKEKINGLVHSVNKNHVIIVTSDYKKDQFGTGLSICIPGTEGHETDIDVDPAYTFMTKTQHSCFSSAGFIHHLKRNDIKRLLLCGFLAEYCVMQTALDALRLGYEVVLIQDSIGTGDDVQHRKEQMLISLKEQGAAVQNSFA
ncbi:cysteine hydrolase family protein [Chitinophaga sp. S165]|uniref:cysteine hydrolase family protein n=1 Tax=Chitinophaga sp. S165 TaxID=2135462 RepID=UPI000D70A93E|nr:isochorismatase family cysteine hydrolase [Chitinophaga sp. S165]PWV49083.1 nicotinamidase-related amidase [Chitinophaga sp. S165]